MEARKLLSVAALAAALIPSARLALRSLDVPHLGYFHDDALYLASARSLSEGSGYRIPSLPGQPPQTRYPPLYPLLLSLTWRIAPSFPGNLPAAMLLGWLMTPVLLILASCAFTGMGLPANHRAALCAVLALNPFLAFLSVSLMSDVMFTCFLLAALILAERATKSDSGCGWALAGGITGGACFLVRSAALPLLVSVPLLFLMARQRKMAFLFAGAMLPAVAGWQIWARAHTPATSDPALPFYVNYLGYYLDNISWADLPLFVWKNFGDLVSSTGSLILFGLSDSFRATTLSRLLAFASIAGVVRMARRGGARHYALFAGFYAALLLVWHYPPNERFVLPIFPLLLAGFSVELLHLLELARRSFQTSRITQRIVGGLTLAASAGLAALIAFQTFTAFHTFLPGVLEEQRSRRAGRQAAYEWISRNVPREAGFLAYCDPVLYLRTGHTALSVRIPPKLAYREDREGIRRLFQSLPAIAEKYNLHYLFLTPADYERDLPEEERIAMLETIRKDPRFQPVYRSAAAAVFRVDR